MIKYNLAKRVFVIVMLLLLLLTTVCFVVSSADGNDSEPKTQTPPSIVIDTKDYDLESVPNAVPNIPYKIFDANANDMFGVKLDVDVKVYLFYSSQTRSRVYLEDNFFTPVYSGVYTVEYTTTDRTGNSSFLTYDVHCVDKAALSATVENKVSSAISGVPIKIGDIVIQNTSGLVDYSITVKNGDRTFVVDEEGCFTPTFAGEYIVTYDYYDYNEKGSCSYSISVEPNPNLIIYDDVDLQKYYILGETYNIPVPSAYSYEFGYPVKITPSAKICYENGLEYDVDDTSNYIFNRVGEFSIEYSACFKGKEEKLIKKDIICVDVGYKDAKDNGRIKVENYFYANDCVKKETTRYGVKLTTATNDSVVSFINKLMSAEFTLGFGFSKTSNHFDELNITLTDSVDKSQKIRFSIIRDSDSVSNFAINGTIVSKVTSSFYNEDTTNLQYNNKTRTINIGNIENLVISKTLYSEKFDGFTSDYITMSLEFSEVYGASSLYVYKVNNQTLSLAGDNAAPHIYYDSYSGGKKSLGDKITVTRLYLCDVFAPSYNVNYSIVRPDGTYVVDENGLSLSPENTDYETDYTFVANVYGTYRVSIKIFDAFGNSDEIVYGITVADLVAPIIYLEDNSQQSAKVGDVITIRSATAKDDISGDLTVYAYLLAPTLYAQEYAIGDKIVLNQKGIYYVYYYAYDEAGNAGFAKYKIIAE